MEKITFKTVTFQCLIAQLCFYIGTFITWYFTNFTNRYSIQILTPFDYPTCNYLLYTKEARLSVHSFFFYAIIQIGDIMKIIINEKIPNWNEYINKERANKYGANKLKQEEKLLMKKITNGQKFTGEYPIEIIVTKHFKKYIGDLDNVRIKGILDGLVANGVIVDDSNMFIRKITYFAKVDKKDFIELEIREYDVE